MSTPTRTIYQVIRVDEAIVFCKHCNGSGNGGVKIHGSRYTEEKCPVCGGRGKTKIKKETRTDLASALQELGVSIKQTL